MLDTYLDCGLLLSRFASVASQIKLLGTLHGLHVRLKVDLGCSRQTKNWPESLKLIQYKVLTLCGSDNNPASGYLVLLSSMFHSLTL